MAVTQLDLPYRPCVGIMLINRQGLVWVGRRRPKWAGDGTAHIWQMPQGGITAGEAAADAALRELEEETGVTSVTVLAEAPDRECVIVAELDFAHQDKIRRELPALTHQRL